MAGNKAYDLRGYLDYLYDRAPKAYAISPAPENELRSAQEALRGRIRDLEAEWLESEQKIMSADVPDMAELAALSADAAKNEQAMIDYFYDDSWRDIKTGGRYARFWSEKNKKLGLS